MKKLKIALPKIQLDAKKNTANKNKKPIYKQWWFWIIIIMWIIIIGVGYSSQKIADGVKDYNGQDAKIAYDELSASKFSIRFVFDRNNNGGFSEDDFQKYVLDSFAMSDYSSNPFVVTKQDISPKNITLYVDYKTVVDMTKKQEEREKKLEERLSIVEATTACENYGKRNYQNFKMHSILGKITESAYDENTWFLKYYVDANGYKELSMECYVTGTSSSPQVTKFLLY